MEKNPSNLSSKFQSRCIINFISCFNLLVLKKQYFYHSLMDIHQIYPSFQMWSLLSSFSYKKQDWYRGRVSDSGPRGLGFSSWSLHFSFFLFRQWKLKEIHQKFDEFSSSICKIFIKWILKFLFIWWNFNNDLMNFHQFICWNFIKFGNNSSNQWRTWFHHRMMWV